MQTPLKDELAVAVELARTAGEIMRQYFDGDQKVTIKTDGSPVTIADLEINKMVIEKLTEVFPSDGVIGEEESNSDYGMGRKWFCDPIDGTRAFTWGVPTAMFSLGLCIDGESVLGVAYDPFLDRIYTATKGSGAFCNDESISVSGLTLKQGIVVLTDRSKKEIEMSNFHKYVANNELPTAVFNGSVYKGTLIARGKLVGLAEKNISPHDIAAIDIIVREAGGKVTDLDGNALDYSKDFKGAIVSNAAAFEQILEACK